MATISDARFDALRTQGFTGSTSDMVLQWLQAAGATSNSIPVAKREVLVAFTLRPAETYHPNDYWYYYLGQLGYEGDINLRTLQFWQAGGILTPLDVGFLITEAGDFLITEAGDFLVVEGGV